MANDFLDIDVEEVRELVRDRAQPLDVYKAIPCPCNGSQGTGRESTRSEGGCTFGCIGGFLYEKREFAPEIAESLAIVYDFNKTTYHPDLGRVPSGEAKWISMADECKLGDADIVVLKSAPENARALVKRRSGFAFEELPHPCVTSVIEIRRGTTVYSEGTDFELVLDETGRFARARLVWTGASPPVGEYYSAEYERYHRLIWLSDGNRPARSNLAGKLLVQRGTLTILTLTQENR